MRNRKSSNKRTHKTLKILQVKDLKLDYLFKGHKKEVHKEIEKPQTLEEYVKDKSFLESKELYSITLNICETITNLNSLNYSIMCSQLDPSNMLMNKNKKIYIKDFEFLNDSLVNDYKSIQIPNCKNKYEKQHSFDKAIQEKVVYNIGILMYFMATGKAPITKFEPLFEDSYANNIPSNLKRIIQKCFDIDIKRRYISIEELKNEILIELLTKSKYIKIEDSSSNYKDSAKSLDPNRLKRVDKRKSRNNFSSVFSKVNAALSSILFT